MEAFDPRDTQQAVALGVCPLLALTPVFEDTIVASVCWPQSGDCGPLQVLHELWGHLKTRIMLAALELDMESLFSSDALAQLAVTIVGP